MRGLTPGEYTKYLFADELVSKFDKDWFSRCEIGCGIGNFLKVLENKNLSCVGIDLSRKGLAIAKDRIKSQNISLLLGSIRDLKGKFDMIFMFDVLEHLEDDKGELEYISCNLLNSNGYLIVSVPAHGNLYGAMDKYLGHYRRYSRESLINIFNECNLACVSIWSYGFKSLSVIANISFWFIEKFYPPKNISYTARSLESGTIFFSSLWNLISLIISKFYPLIYRYEYKHRDKDNGNSYIIIGKKEEDINILL